MCCVESRSTSTLADQSPATETNDRDIECRLSGGEALLTSTEDTVGLWQKHSEDLHIPTDTSWE